MAEYCLECWNKLNGTNDSQRKYVISEDEEKCEGCGEWKRVIVREKRSFKDPRIRDVLLIPLRLLFFIPLFVWKFVIHPYVIKKKTEGIKSNKK